MGMQTPAIMAVPVIRQSCNNSIRLHGYFYFLERHDLIITSLPSKVIFWHRSAEISAGIMFRYCVNLSDKAPRPPMTIGTTIHSQFHIFANSTLRPLYFESFSFSLAVTLTSLGQLTSNMYVFFSTCLL